MPSESLKDKTVKGTIWSSIDSIARYGITFIVGIILARLLSPDEYGLIGIITIFISFFTILIDGGFATAIIRKQDATDIDYSTMFFVNMGVSLFLALVFFACAKPIASFFEREELVSLIHVMAWIVVINALSAVQQARLTKRIDFKSQTKISIISSTSSGVIGIIMAMKGYGVWSLVGQHMSRSFFNSVLLFLFNRWKPSLRFSKESFKEMWSFGWKLMASGLLGSLSTEAYAVAISKFFSPATLGQYSRANQFGSIFSSNITTIVSRVSFPVLSTIQYDVSQMKNAYRRIIKTTIFPTFVLTIGIAACAPTMILCLIGEKWLPSAGYLRIICLYAMMHPLHALNLNAIQVMGRSDLTFRLKIIKTFLVIIPLTLGYFFGIYAMLLGSLGESYFSFYLNTLYSKSLLNYGIWEQIKDILPPLGIALIIAVPVFFMNYLPFSPYILFPLQIIVGGLLMLTICEIVKPDAYMELKSIILRK